MQPARTRSVRSARVPQYVRLQRLALTIRSQWLLLLYVTAVLGGPALHLGWHHAPHSHDHHGLHFLPASAKTPQHVHAHLQSGAPAHTHQGPLASTSLRPAFVLQQPVSRHAGQRAQAWLPALAFATNPAAAHLVGGAAHGQFSLLSPAVQADIGRADGGCFAPVRATRARSSLCRALLRARAPPTLF